MGKRRSRAETRSQSRPWPTPCGALKWKWPPELFPAQARGQVDRVALPATECRLRRKGVCGLGQGGILTSAEAVLQRVDSRVPPAASAPSSWGKKSFTLTGGQI